MVECEERWMAVVAARVLGVGELVAVVAAAAGVVVVVAVVLAAVVVLAVVVVGAPFWRMVLVVVSL